MAKMDLIFADSKKIVSYYPARSHKYFAPKTYTLLQEVSLFYLQSEVAPSSFFVPNHCDCPILYFLSKD